MAKATVSVIVEIVAGEVIQTLVFSTEEGAVKVFKDMILENDGRISDEDMDEFVVEGGFQQDDYQLWMNHEIDVEK